MFIYDDTLWNSDVGMRASFCHRDFVWNVLGLKSMYIHVLASNKRALQYNLLFGCEVVPGYENEENLKLIITREKAMQPNPRLDRIERVLRKTM